VTTRALLALLVLLLSLDGRASAQDEGEACTLDRQQGAVVVTGERLTALLGLPIERLRLFAARGGALAPIAFQVDERTPEGGYAFDGGEERRSDSDEGHLDPNDELVFMARDAGARLPATSAALPGEGARVVLALSTPDRDQSGWVYLLSFQEAAPPLPARDLVSLTWDGPEVTGWAGERARVVCAPGGTSVLDWRELRFARPGGGYGVDVIDRAKLSFKARYLFLDLARREDEVRAHFAGFIDGPVRVVARVTAETYLIWGHWVRTTPRSQLVIYDDRLELDLEVRLPVALEPDSNSELRVALDFSPEAGDLSLWTEQLRRPVRPGRVARGKELPTGPPAWICVSSPDGALLMRLDAGPNLSNAPRTLHLEDGAVPDPPEDVPGSHLCAGYAFDLTGLVPATYRARLTLQLGPSLQPGGEARLLAPDASPLRVEVVAAP
jgi:hypothetical protein